jgi:hypothetical protein
VFQIVGLVTVMLGFGTYQFLPTLTKQVYKLPSLRMLFLP